MRRSLVAAVPLVSLLLVDASSREPSGSLPEAHYSSLPTADLETVSGRAAVAPIDVAQIDSIIRHALATQKFVGLSVGIAQDGRIVFARGYGSRSLTPRDAVTPQTTLAIGSVT